MTPLSAWPRNTRKQQQLVPELTDTTQQSSYRNPALGSTNHIDASRRMQLCFWTDVRMMQFFGSESRQSHSQKNNFSLKFLRNNYSSWKFILTIKIHRLAIELRNRDFFEVVEC